MYNIEFALDNLINRNNKIALKAVLIDAHPLFFFLNSHARYHETSILFRDKIIM